MFEEKARRMGVAVQRGMAKVGYVVSDEAALRNGWRIIRYVYGAEAGELAQASVLGDERDVGVPRQTESGRRADAGLAGHVGSSVEGDQGCRRR